MKSDQQRVFVGPMKRDHCLRKLLELRTAR